MRNFIPYFIQDRILAGESQGAFEGAGLFLDISGFTAMTRELMTRGKEGAEVLSSIINSLFEPLIEAVYDQGGFVTVFAGDAFTAVFPSQEARGAFEAAAEIQRIFEKHGKRTTRLGEFDLAVKVGLSFGQIEWGIPGGQSSAAFYFRGDAVEGCARAEHHANRGDIILDSNFRARLEQTEFGGQKFAQLADTYYRYDGTTHHSQRARQKAQKAPSLLNRKKQKSVGREITSRFVPEVLLDTDLRGEFRDIASVFVSIADVRDFEDIRQFTNLALDKKASYGGYFNSLDFGDKGCTILAFFGAPISHEDNLIRAAHFAFELIEALGERAKAGLNFGTAYAGIVGSSTRMAYTALGDVVNLSARLMVASNSGKVWMPENLTQQIRDSYEVMSVGAMEFKGIDAPVGVVEISGTRKMTFEGFDEVPFYGREEEMARVAKRFERLHDGRTAGLVYYYGGAGSGKSRMLHEIWVAHKDEADFHFMQADGILRKGLNPFSGYFTNYFVTNSEDDGDEQSRFTAEFRRIISEAKQSSHPDRDEIVAELERTRSFLAALAGVHIAGSLYDLLEPEARFNNTLFAVSAFFQARALVRPTIVILEDLHFLDSDSKAVFEVLLRQRESLPILFLASSRYNDDGSRPRLPAPPELEQVSEALDTLPDSAVELIIAVRIGGQPDEELMQFIKERTMHNAFFVEQFCIYLRQNELLGHGEDGMVKLKNMAQDIPASINAIVVARIDRLSPELKEAVQAASVVGRNFDLKILAPLLDTSVESLQELIKAGEREQLWEATAIEEFRFRNGMLRFAAYDMQLRDRLRALHARVARTIERMYPNRPDLEPDIAYHYEAAEELDQARVHYYKAAANAGEAYRTHKALAFYERLHELALNSEERRDVQRQRAELLQISGSWEEARIILDGLLAETDETGDELLEAEYRVQIGEILQQKGDNESALEHLKRSADLLAGKQNGLLGRALRTKGRAYWSMGYYEDALGAYKEALKADSAHQAESKTALNHYYIGVVFRDQGRYNEALKEYEAAYQIFEKIGDKLYITYPLYDMAVLYQYEGKLDEAFNSFQSAAESYEEIGYKSGSSAALLNQGLIKGRKGDYEAAHALLSRSLHLARELGEQLAIAYTHFSIGVVYYQEHRYHHTFRSLQDAFLIMRSIDARGYFGYVYSYLVCTFARTGQIARALHAALKHVRNIETLGGSDVENGRTYMGIALALKHAGAARPNAKKLTVELQEVTGIRAEAKAFFEAAIDRARRANYKITLVPALREYGYFLLSKGEEERSRAIELFDEAYGEARQSGMLHEQQIIENYCAEHSILLKSVQ